MTASPQELLQATVDASLDEADVEMAPVEKDLETIFPEATTLTVGGFPARVRRFKTREVLLLVRIVTVGFGEGITSLDFSTDDADQLKADILAVITLALPNAIDETIALLTTIVEPEVEANEGAVRAAMVNPELDVMVDVVDIVMDQEMEDWLGLVGKVRRMAARQAALMEKTRKKGPKAGG